LASAGPAAVPTAAGARTCHRTAKVDGLDVFCREARPPNHRRASAGDFARVRAAGWDAAIVAIIAQVAVNVVTNTFNDVARTPIDSPVRQLHRTA
jgi:hypothetical protein